MNFLHHFPMYSELFNKFNSQVVDFIRQVHDSYVLYYVQKRGKEIRIPKHIFTHICKLHLEFIYHLRNVMKKSLFEKKW